MENQPSKLDKAVKISIIMGIILVVTSFIYYFLVKPKQEERAFADCLSALKDSGKFNNITISSPVGKAALDVCVKSRGAEQIRVENDRKTRQEEAERQKKAEEQIKKELTSNELGRLIIEDFNATQSDFGGNFYFKGKIKNKNNFDVRNIKLKVEIFSPEKEIRNKLEEKEYDLSEIFYAGSVKDFQVEYYTGYKSFSYKYSIIKAETDAGSSERISNNISADGQLTEGEEIIIQEKYEDLLEKIQKQKEEFNLE